MPTPARYSLLKFLAVLSKMGYGTSNVTKESDVNSIAVEQGEALRINMRENELKKVCVLDCPCTIGWSLYLE